MHVFTWPCHRCMPFSMRMLCTRQIVFTRRCILDAWHFILFWHRVVVVVCGGGGGGGDGGALAGLTVCIWSCFHFDRSTCFFIASQCYRCVTHHPENEKKRKIFLFHLSEWLSSFLVWPSSWSSSSFYTPILLFFRHTRSLWLLYVHYYLWYILHGNMCVRLDTYISRKIKRKQLRQHDGAPTIAATTPPRTTEVMATKNENRKNHITDMSSSWI